jgi:hypothetical protein
MATLVRRIVMSPERPEFLAVGHHAAAGHRLHGNSSIARAVVQRSGCSCIPGESCACEEREKASPAVSDVVELQRFAGNRAVADLVIQPARCGLVPAATCAAPISGSAEEFSASEAAVEASPRARRAAMSPARQVSTGHTGQARQLELILNAHVPGVLTNVHGIFLDRDMSPGTAAFVDSCANMVPPVPAPPGKKCVFVPPALNRQALRFRQGNARVGGMDREDWRVQTLQTLVHEIQHVAFEAAGLGQPAGVTAAACARADVEFELSEMAAIMSEFPVAFRAIPAGVPPGHPARARLASWFINAVSNPSESIQGALTTMRCKCDCAEVDAFVGQTFAFVSAPWSPAERAAFNGEMRDPAHALHWPL